MGPADREGDLAAVARERLVEISRASGVGGWAWDLRLDVVLVAGGAAALSSADAPAPASPKSCLARLHPDDRHSVVTAVRAAIAIADDDDAVAGGATVVDMRVADETGWRWFRCRCTALRDEAGSVVEVSGSYWDISEVRAVEAALRDQVQRTAALRRMTAVANQSSSFAEAVRQARELVATHAGWPRLVAWTLTPDGLVPVGPAGSVREAELAERVSVLEPVAWSPDRRVVALACGYDDVVAGVLVMSSSDPLPVEMVTDAGQAIGLQFGRVAERERAQGALAEARDAAVADARDTAHLLATLSHEVRTPLNGIIGLNDLLLRSELVPDQLRLASGVQVAARALLSVMNDVLDVSRLDSGRLRLERVEFEPRELLDAVARTVGPDARAARVDLVLTCDTAVPGVLSGDVKRLHQVLVNLVLYSVSRRTPADADLSPGTERVLHVDLSRRSTGAPRSSSTPETLGLVVQVSDSGPGVGSAASSDPGLGLTIADQIVSALGGTLEHRPHESGEGGEGLGFIVELAVPSTGVGPLDEYGRTWLAGRRVLVADGSARHRHHLEGQLGWWQVRAQSVATTDDALAALRSSKVAGDPFEAVLIGLDGPESLALAGAVASDPALDEVVMVVLAPGEADVPRLRESGVSVCLSRPTTAAQVRGTLLEQLAGVAAAPMERHDGRRGRPVRRRVLVVEDNAVNQMVATGLLEALGYSVEVAEHGGVALERIVERTASDEPDFDAVLMDVHMPVLDGYATTRAIRGAGHRLPIVAMTAAAVEGERERCLEAGMDDFLTKPVDPVTLADTLTDWLGAEPDAGSDVLSGAAEGAGLAAEEHGGDHLAPVAADAAPLPPTAPIEGLDVARLDMLRDLDPGETTYLDRAIANFQVNSEAAVSAIADLVAAGDVAAVRAAAHKIAGSALNLGAPRAGAAGRAVEILAATGSLAPVDPLLRELDDTMAEARGLLLSYQRTYRVLMERVR